MSDKILPCPFCGGEADYYEARDGYCDRHVIECGNCGCSKRSEYYQCVFDDWKQRYNIEKPILDIERTEALVDELSLLMLKARKALKDKQHEQ